MSDYIVPPSPVTQTEEALKQSLTASDSQVMYAKPEERQPDPAVINILTQTGQVGNNSLNRSLYGNAFVRPVADATREIKAPRIEGQDYSGLSFLTDQQEQFFTQSSAQIAEQSNLTRDSLAQSLSGQVRAIETAAQDRAVIAGIQTGDLGMPAEKSTRNLSFIADAQAVAQQQLIETTNKYVNELSQIDLQARQAQTEILGQVVNTQQAERARLDDLSAMMTQALGTLHTVDDQGVILDTGQLTLQGKAANLDLRAGEFQLNAAQAEASEFYKLGADGMIQFGPDGRALVTDLGELRRRADMLIAQADTEEAKMAIENMYKQQELMQMFNTPADMQAAQEKYGSAIGRYYGIEQGPNGNVGFYDDTALSTIGLDLNTSFQGSQGSLIPKENVEEIRKSIALDISKAMFSGESANFMNKIYAESDDRGSMLFALRNIGQGKNGYEAGYNFFEMNTKNMSDKDKSDMRNELSALDAKNPQIFENFLNVAKKFESKGLVKDDKISASNFMDRLNGGSYNSARNNEIIQGVKTPQLIGAVLMGTTAGSLKNLENMNLVRLNDEGFLDFEPMKSAWVTNAEDAINSLSKGGWVANTEAFIRGDQGIGNKIALQNALRAYQGQLNINSVPAESRVFFEQNKDGMLQFNKQTRTLLEGLVNVDKFMEKSISDKNRRKDTYMAFLTSTMGSYGVDRRQATNLLALVETIRSGGANIK